MNATDQLRMRQHAERLGLRVEVSTKHNELTTAFLMNTDGNTYVLGFVANTYHDCIGINWFVNGKMYNNKMTLDQFMRLSVTQLEAFRRGNVNASQRAEELSDELKDIPIVFKRDCAFILGIK
jgi:hypothetical protein